MVEEEEKNNEEEEERAPMWLTTILTDPILWSEVGKVHFSCFAGNI